MRILLRQSQSYVLFLIITKYCLANANSYHELLHTHYTNKSYILFGNTNMSFSVKLCTLLIIFVWMLNNNVCYMDTC